MKEEWGGEFGQELKEITEMFEMGSYMYINGHFGLVKTVFFYTINLL